MVGAPYSSPAWSRLAGFVDQAEVGPVDRREHIQRPVHLFEKAPRVALVRQTQAALRRLIGGALRVQDVVV